MAIKISGNTIIDDSRNIVNAANAAFSKVSTDAIQFNDGEVFEGVGVINNVASLNASNQDLVLRVNNTTGVSAGFDDGAGSYGILHYGGAGRIEATSYGAKISGDLRVRNITFEDDPGLGALNGIASFDYVSTQTINTVIDNRLWDTGGGIVYSSGVIAHSDTSSQASVNNSGTTVIQDITLDGYGHITSIGSTTIEIGALGTSNTGVYGSTETRIYPGGDVPYSQDFFRTTLSQDTIIDLRNNGISQHWGKVYKFDIAVVQSTANNGPHTVTWDAAIKWPGGSAPSISTGNGDEDLFTFITIDGGTTYYGSVFGQNMS